MWLVTRSGVPWRGIVGLQWVGLIPKLALIFILYTCDMFLNLYQCLTRYLMTQGYAILPLHFTELLLCQMLSYIQFSLKPSFSLKNHIQPGRQPNAPLRNLHLDDINRLLVVLAADFRAIDLLRPVLEHERADQLIRILRPLGGALGRAVAGDIVVLDPALHVVLEFAGVDVGREVVCPAERLEEARGRGVEHAVRDRRVPGCVQVCCFPEEADGDVVSAGTVAFCVYCWGIVSLDACMQK